MPKEDTWFKKGHAGGPGRPAGSKNKLSEDFLEALAESFKKHGKEAIEHVVKNSPGEYLRIIANLVPKELLVEVATENQTQWVINCQPTLTVEEWQEMHGLEVLKEPESVHVLDKTEK